MDTGIGIANPLFFVGVVENNKDGRKEGRVQVRAFGVHGSNKDVPTDLLPWAIVVQGGYNPNSIPNVNDWVFGVFLDGRDAQNPMVLGLIPVQYTDPIDPKNTGWGRVPEDRDRNELAAGSTPEDIMEPRQSKLLRGERLETTSLLTQEMGRTMDVPIGGTDETWDQPSTSFNTEYPNNKVWETAHHSIQLDDTPHSERITITHKSGSFIEIDAQGTTTNKTVGDQYDVMDRKQHVVIGGMSTVTILGNSYVYVKGNKTEEIEGDLQTLVHGNHMLSVGGQSTHQAGEQVQIRGGGDVIVNGGSGTVSVSAGKELQLGTTDTYGAVSIKSEKILVDARDKLGLRAVTQFNISSLNELNIHATAKINQLTALWSAHSTGNTLMSALGTMNLSGTIDVAISGGTQVNVNTPIANIGGGIVNLAPAAPPRAATDPAAALVGYFSVAPITQSYLPVSPYPEIAWTAAKVDAPEPVTKSTSIISNVINSSMSAGGVAARDHTGSNNQNNSGSTTYEGGNISAATQSAVTPLLDFIGNKESKGYDDISRLVADHRHPTLPLTQMTIQQVLDWQESIDASQLSEASGRYQIMEDTLRGYDNDKGVGPGSPLYTKAGLSASDLFSPANQDKLAIQLIEQRGLSKYLDGTITKEQFGNNLAAEWASLPLVSGSNMGLSRYNGDSAGNKALTTVAEFLAVLEQIKAANNNVTDQENGGPQ